MMQLPMPQGARPPAGPVTTTARPRAPPTNPKSRLFPRYRNAPDPESGAGGPGAASSSLASRGWQLGSTALLIATTVIAITAVIGMAVTAHLLTENVRRLDKRIGADRVLIAALNTTIIEQEEVINLLGDDIEIINQTMPDGNGTVFFDDEWVMAHGGDHSQQFAFDASAITATHPPDRRTYIAPDADGTLALLADIPPAQTTFSESEFAVYLDGDPTTQLQFDLTLFTAGADRVAQWPNKSGTVAYLSDVIALGGNTTVFLDSEFALENDPDTSRVAVFSAALISTGTEREFSFPDKDGVFAMLADIPAATTAFLDSEFEIQSAADNSSVAVFSAALIAPSTVREFTFPDKDGVLATLSDVSASVISADLELARRGDGFLGVMQDHSVGRWQRQYGPFGTLYSQWYGIAWSPQLELFVAVSRFVSGGDAEQVMTSATGLDWTFQEAAAANSWRAVAWSPALGLFAAVSVSGTGNRVMTSPDGFNWTAQASAVDNNWDDVVWSPDLALFAAVSTSGSGNRVMTSPDGTTWTAASGVPDRSWRSIDWSPELGLFAAVADTGTGDRVMTSPDGFNWTSQASAVDNDWEAVSWSPELGIFAAVASTGSGDRVMTSADGVNWVTRASAADITWTDIAWSPELNLFAAVALSGSANRFMSSANGIDWVIRRAPDTIQWRALAWSPKLGMFAAVASTGGDDRIAISNPTNAMLDAHVAIQNVDDRRKVARLDVSQLATIPSRTYRLPDDQGELALAKHAGGASEYIWRRTVGTWSTESSGSGESYVDAAWSPSLALFAIVNVCGCSTGVMTSPDGVTWTFQSTPSVVWRGIAWSPDLALFAVVGDNAAMTSPDGVTWTQRSVPNSRSWQSVTWSAELGYFVAIAAWPGGGSDELSARSSDGITWTTSTVGWFDSYRSITWSPDLGIFVAVANGGPSRRIVVSSDGANWDQTLTLDIGGFESVTWSPELQLFVIVGFNTIRTSTDGLHWTTRVSPASNGWEEVRWSPELGVFLAVADSGSDPRMMTSPDGIRWTLRDPPTVGSWDALAWSPALSQFMVTGDAGGDVLLSGLL